MKIAAYVKEKMKRTRFAMRTEPPVTSELLKIFKQVSGGQFDHHSISVDADGHLLVNPPIMAHHVKILEEAFTMAEKHVGAQKANAEKEHEEFLKAVSEQAGLPLE